MTPSIRLRSERPATVERTVRTVVARVCGAALLAVLAAGCSTVNGDAARVGNDRLSSRTFEDLLDGYTAATGSGSLPTGNVDAQVARIILLDWISSTALERTLLDYGVEISDADLAEAESSLADQAGFADAGDAVRDFYIWATAIRTLTGTTFSPDTEELADLYAAGPEESGLVCLRIMLTETREEIDAALARIDAGESFAAVAADVSTDSSAASGGVLTNDQTGGDCYPFDQIMQEIVEPIARVIPESRPGDISAPIEIPDVGWVAVTSRPFSEVLDDAREIIGPITTARLSESALDNSTIWVNPEFGRWDAESRRVAASS